MNRWALGESTIGGGLRLGLEPVEFIYLYIYFVFGQWIIGQLKSLQGITKEDFPEDIEREREGCQGCDRH